MTGQPEECVPGKAWRCLHGPGLHAGIMKGKYNSREEVAKMPVGFIPIDCPYCGRKVMEVSARFDQHSTRSCPGCKKRLRIDWDWKTQHASVGPA